MPVTMVVNAKSYDWGTWLIGIMRSFIGGGAGAIVSSVTTMGLDSKTFNITSADGLKHVLLQMGISFILIGMVHLAMFLQTHGAPELEGQGQPTTTKDGQ